MVPFIGLFPRVLAPGWFLPVLASQGPEPPFPGKEENGRKGGFPPGL